MARRLELDQLLRTTPGIEKVYFQQTENLQLVYPCLVYARDTARTQHADNRPYRFTQRYQIMIIDRVPDNDETREFIESLPMCIFVRSYVADKLHHTIYNIYF